MSVHSCVRRSGWRTPNSGRFKRAKTVTGDVEEHRKQCQLQLYLTQGIIPRHTLGNISWRRHFGAFQLHNGTMLDIHSSTPDVFLYQGAPGVEPIVAFPGRTLLTPGAVSLDTKGRLRLQLPAAGWHGSMSIAIVDITANAPDGSQSTYNQHVQLLLLVENIHYQTVVTHIDIMIDSTDTPTFVDASGNIVATDSAPQIVKAFSFSDLLIPEGNGDTYRNRTLVAIFFENPNGVVVPDGITQVHNVQTDTWTPLLGTGCRVHVLSHMYVHVIGKGSPATTNANALAVQADSPTNANVLAVQAGSTTAAVTAVITTAADNSTVESVIWKDQFGDGQSYIFGASGTPWYNIADAAVEIDQTSVPSHLHLRDKPWKIFDRTHYLAFRVNDTGSDTALIAAELLVVGTTTWWTGTPPTAVTKMVVAYRYKQGWQRFAVDPQHGDLLFVFHFGRHSAYSYVNDIAMDPVVDPIQDWSRTEQQFRDGVDAGTETLQIGMMIGHGLRGRYYNCHRVYNDSAHDAQRRTVVREQLQTQLGFRF